ALPIYGIIELRDTWAAKAAADAAAAAEAAAQAEAQARAAKREASKAEAENRRSRTEVRDEIRAANPDLAERLARYTDELGLAFEDADVLTGDEALARFFEDALAAHNNPQSVANWITNEVLREAKDTPIEALSIRGEQVGALAKLVDEKTITAAIAKEVFA